MVLIRKEVDPDERHPKILRKSSRVVLITVLMLCCWIGDVQAQGEVLGTYAFEARWLDGVGALSHNYNAGGAEPEPAMVGQGWTWPAHVPHADNHRGNGVTFATTDWTDENGRTWQYKVSHIGMRPSGLSEHFPQQIEQVSRFKPPETVVDGFESFRVPTFNDRVDPGMKADRMIHIVFNNFFGLRIDKKAKQFSNTYHDDYHVIEWTLTNTGNTDEDQEIEKPNQTLTGVYMSRQYLPYISGLASYYPNMGGAGWGYYNMRDVVGDGMEDYDVDFRATYEWAGKNPGFERWNDIGMPAITDNGSYVVEGDSSGRLLASYMIGSVTAHADKEPSETPPGEDDPDQPTTTTYVDIETPLAGASGFNEDQMRREYTKWIAAGHTYPHHADAVARPEDGDYSWDPVRMANQKSSPSFGGGGRMILNSYGPYTLKPGESVRIVEIRGLAGLSDTANEEVGNQYKKNWLNGEPTKPIAFDADGDGKIESDEEMRKNLWVMTARDSLFKLFEMALDNYNSGYNIPQPPKPPKRFVVTSGSGEIRLEWEAYGESPAKGWELYRAPERVQSTPEKEFEYDLVAGTDELGPSARSYTDQDVERGIGYFYYLQAVGEVNNNPTGMTPTGVRLRSNRYYTQTYDPARLQRPPGGALNEVTIVPNPYNLGSEESIRWPDQENQIAFLDLPAKSTIRIYTELGELVETIEHTDGSGDDFWDLSTSSEQLIVSGVYLAVITDQDTGERITKKIIIIR